jgi:hypothetical protein
MIHQQFIEREWVVSATAKRVYRSTAAVSIVFFFFAVTLSMSMRGNPDVPALSLLLAKPVVLIFALATAITEAGMFCFLFLFDTSPGLKQVFWFLAMMIPPFGPALFCFRVYSRSSAFDPISKEESLRTSA